MNITGLGPSIVEKLFAANLVKDVAHIYRLQEEDFLLLEGVKEKSAAINCIRLSKHQRNFVERSSYLFWEFDVGEARFQLFLLNISIQ